MTYIKVLLIGLIAAASSAAADDPPPFGTLLGEWNLPMSGAYAGAGSTWRQDIGLFYLMDQGYSGQAAVWKLDPADPTGSIQPEPWVFANLGGSIADVPWGLCWDADSGCFWMSQILDGSIYAGCYLLRMVETDSAWFWRGTPADSWRIDSAPRIYWMAGMAKWQDLGYFLGAGIGEAGTPGFVKFDPYTKTRLGVVPCDSGGAGIGLVPADSYYIIGTDLDTAFFEWDTTGRLLRRAGTTVYGPASLALIAPEHPAPQDTVVFYCICSDPNNTLQKISVGLLWGQLRSGQAIGEPGWPAPAGDDRLRIEPNPCRGVLHMGVDSGQYPVSRGGLLDAAGRKVLDLHPGANDVRSLVPGVYFVREPRAQAQTQAVRKIVIVR